MSHLPTGEKRRRNIVFIGCPGVGKSQLVNKLIGKEFQDSYTPSKPFQLSPLTTNGLSLNIYDTAGDPNNYISVNDFVLEKAYHVFIVIDVTNQDSYDKVFNFITRCREKNIPYSRITLVANKLDIPTTRVINDSKIVECMGEYKLKYIPTSAKGTSSERLRKNLCEPILANLRKPQLDFWYQDLPGTGEECVTALYAIKENLKSQILNSSHINRNEKLSSKYERLKYILEQLEIAKDNSSKEVLQSVKFKKAIKDSINHSYYRIVTNKSLANKRS